MLDKLRDTLELVRYDFYVYILTHISKDNMFYKDIQIKLLEIASAEIKFIEKNLGYVLIFSCLALCPTISKSMNPSSKSLAKHPYCPQYYGCNKCGRSSTSPQCFYCMTKSIRENNQKKKK